MDLLLLWRLQVDIDLDVWRCMRGILGFEECFEGVFSAGGYFGGVFFIRG